MSRKSGNRFCEKDMRNRNSACPAKACPRARHEGGTGVLKARFLSFAQEIDVVRDDPAQSLDPWPLVLGKVAEHVSVHEILHPGMADPDAHAAIVVAHMRRDRA